MKPGAIPKTSMALPLIALLALAGCGGGATNSPTAPSASSASGTVTAAKKAAPPLPVDVSQAPVSSWGETVRGFRGARHSSWFRTHLFDGGFVQAMPPTEHRTAKSLFSSRLTPPRVADHLRVSNFRDKQDVSAGRPGFAGLADDRDGTPCVAGIAAADTASGATLVRVKDCGPNAESRLGAWLAWLRSFKLAG